MKKILLWMVRLIITSGLLIFIITRINFAEFFNIIKQLNLTWYLPFFFLLFLIILIGTLRWKWLLEVQGIKLSAKQVFRLSYLGLFFSNFMLGGIGGDLSKAVLVANQTTFKTRAITSIIVDRFVGFLGSLVLGLGGIIIYWNKRELVGLKITFMILVAGILFFLLCYQWLKRISFPLRSRGGEASRFYPSFQRIFNEINIAITTYKNNKIVLLKSLLVSIIIHCVIVIINIAFSIALGIKDISYSYYFVIIPIINLLVSLPISLGGWGVSETSYGYLMGLINLSLTQAVALSLVFRLSFILWTLPGGLFLLGLNLRRDHRLSHQISHLSRYLLYLPDVATHHNIFVSH